MSWRRCGQKRKSFWLRSNGSSRGRNGYAWSSRAITRKRSGTRMHIRWRKAIPGTRYKAHIGVTGTADWFIPWRQQQLMSMMPQKHPGCWPEMKMKYMATAVTSEQKSAAMRSSATRLVARSNTESTAVHPKWKSWAKAVSMPQRKQNTQSPLSAPKVAAR